MMTPEEQKLFEELKFEHREAMRRLEAVDRVIGDPVHPRYSRLSAVDLAFKILAITSPSLDTDEEIDNDPILRGITRYEDKIAEELEEAKIRIAELETELKAQND